MNTISSNIICPVCQSDDIHEQDSQHWCLYDCQKCSHVFSEVENETTNLHFEGKDYRKWRIQNERILRELAEQRMHLVKPFLTANQGRAFELGCSTGEALQVLADSGWASYGVDLSEGAISLCRELHPNINTAIGTDATDLFEGEFEPFDLVMAFHVVEHIADLSTLATRLSQYCREGAILYICVPNWDSWCRRTMGDEWPDLMPEHIHYFGHSSIRRWLSNSGFELAYVKTGSAPWPWLGGVKRKLKRYLGQTKSTSTAQHVMPSTASMTLLRFAKVFLWPLLKAETLMGMGNELIVVARYQPKSANTSP
jgi:2-polyprenyl-3-methyl-5-hydroxy-6-metoxy-1,4-benzoquinol methylase